MIWGYTLLHFWMFPHAIKAAYVAGCLTFSFYAVATVFAMGLVAIYFE